MWKKFFLFTWELAKVTVISLAIIIPVRYYLIQPFYVKGASMEPNFHDHEYLIIDELSYRFRDPQRGEVVVFRYPRNPQEYFIKRIIGLPGEEIQIRDGQVVIYNEQNQNGVFINEAFLEEGTFTYSANQDRISLAVDEYYVLGDNRSASLDSRSFGSLKKQFITGRVFFRGWPFDRVQVFKQLPDFGLMPEVTSID